MWDNSPPSPLHPPKCPHSILPTLFSKVSVEQKQTFDRLSRVNFDSYFYIRTQILGPYMSKKRKTECIDCRSWVVKVLGLIKPRFSDVHHCHGFRNLDMLRIPNHDLVHFCHCMVIFSRCITSRKTRLSISATIPPKSRIGCRPCKAALV